jgi:hypothetical protein
VGVEKNSPYRLVFTGTVGDGELGDIAIDDVSHGTGQCDPEGKLMVFKDVWIYL